MTSAQRDRFTIAHELGHFFLHFPKVQSAHPDDGMKAYRWVESSDTTNQRCEWEANWFAASFLMPETLFRKLYVNDIAHCAAAFDVSEKACKVRASSLGL
jgi:Zn-dependent peptidase ImmA (M78 family)